MFRIRHSSAEVLHTPFSGSNEQRTHGLELEFRFSKYTIIGGIGFGSNSHRNVTVWFTATLLDGRTVKATPAEKYQDVQIRFNRPV